MNGMSNMATRDDIDEVIGIVKDFMSDVSVRFDEVDNQFARIETRFTKVDNQFKEVHERLDSLDKSLTTLCCES